MKILASNSVILTFYLLRIAEFRAYYRFSIEDQLQLLPRERGSSEMAECSPALQEISGSRLRLSLAKDFYFLLLYVFFELAK